MDILGSIAGMFVEATAFDFHGARLVPDGFQSQRTYQPDRLSLHEASHVLTPKQRNVVAEFLLEKIHQTAAVSGFLAAYAIEDCGRSWIVLPQAPGGYRSSAYESWMREPATPWHCVK